ncbi:hypothetical protein HDV00_009805 [Rhizophlyctis rosea]|nr:hypothetical protein HDV00_009805 [Rhizophlyctis rosea]
MRSFFALIGASLVAVSSAQASFTLAGDSTTATAGGWGDAFCSQFVRRGTPCFNGADSGETTASFVSGGFWKRVLNNVKASVGRKETAYVTIQVGHNDQKQMTVSQYSANMRRLIEDVKKAGGVPVVVTSLSRRIYVNNRIDNGLKTFVDAAIAVASSAGVSMLDLNKASVDYLNQVGPTVARTYDLSKGDYTYINAAGGVVFGRIVANLFASNIAATRPYVTVAGSGNPTTSPTTTRANSPSTPTNKPPTTGGSCANQKYAQCGGQGFTGLTCCKDSTCKATNQWYSQCL